MIRLLALYFLFHFALVLASAGQASPPAAQDCKLDAASCSPKTISREKESKAAPGIQDNSFLVEEAYNQEFGVVQHIQTFQRTWTTGDWVYTFTQEWPVDAAPRNQLSYTIPVLHAGSFPGSGGGVGDIALNYRYQLIGNGESKLAFAPRLSLLLSSGDARTARGAGGTGLQTSLPFSVVVSKALVTHWNAGATVVPAAKDPAGEHAAVFGYNLGQSFVWIAKPRFNVLLETVFNSTESVVAANRTERVNTILLSPGVRWAYNFKSGLQIVPGVAVPVGVGPSTGDAGLLLYLSFEHPYRQLRK